MEKKDASFLLEVGNQRITYHHGPKFWKDLKWSGEDENKRVRIVFDDINENRHEKTFDGPWAWFRLQDRSRIKKTRKSNVYLATYTVTELVDDKARGQNKITKKHHSIQFLIKAKSVNNPFNNNLLGAFKCPPSI